MTECPMAHRFLYAGINVYSIQRSYTSQSIPAKTCQPEYISQSSGSDKTTLRWFSDTCLEYLSFNAQARFYPVQIRLRILGRDVP
jgi:hypothetical protein